MTDLAPTASAPTNTDIVLTLSQKETIVTVRLITSGLTLIGACFMIFSMLYFRKLKTLSSRLIFQLTISALGEAIFNYVTLVTFGKEDEFSTLCTFQGLALQVFQLSTFLWTTVISFNLYMVVVKHKISMNQYEPWYHAVVWCITAVMSIIPLLAGAYGPAGVWCWIKKTGSGLPLRFLMFYIPLYICIAVMIYLYSSVVRTVNATMEGQTDLEDEDRKRAQRALMRLRAYPIIFMVLYILPTINRVYNWISNDDIFILYLGQVLTAPLLGFVNSLAYGLDEELRRKYRILFFKRGWFRACIGEVSLDDLDARSGSVDEEEEYAVEDPDSSPTSGNNNNNQSVVL